MLDLRWIRDNPEAFDAALASRGAAPAAARIIALDARHREAVTELQSLQSRRNEASKEIGAVKSKGGDATALMAEIQKAVPAPGGVSGKDVPCAEPEAE